MPYQPILDPVAQAFADATALNGEADVPVTRARHSPTNCAMPAFR
jgi:hypothetical protein